MRTLLSFFFVVVLLPYSAKASSWLLVSLDGESRIVAYQRNPETGEIGSPVSTKTSGSPGSLFFDAKRSVLFAALRSNEKLVSYRFDGKSGKLTLVSEIAVEPDPAYVSLDGTAQWLFSAYYLAGKIAVHAVDGVGRIGEKGTSTLR